MQSSANERNASLLAGYKVSAAYLRKKNYMQRQLSPSLQKSACKVTTLL
jgi:hypothetical protein